MNDVLEELEMLSMQQETVNPLLTTAPADPNEKEAPLLTVADLDKDLLHLRKESRNDLMEKSSLSAGSKVPPKKANSMLDQGNTLSDQNQAESTFDKIETEN